MKPTEKLALHLATQIHSRVGRTSVNVLKYALLDAINYMLFYSTVVILGLITGRVFEALIAPIFFSILRRYSGGFHLSSDINCTIISSIMVMISIYTPGHYWYNGFVYTIISIVLMALFSPSGSKAPKSLHRKFKIISVALVCSNLIIQSHLIGLIFFVQAITTVPFMQKVMDKLRI